MNALNIRIVRKLKESKLQYFAIMIVMMVGILIYISFNIGIYNFENSVNTYYEKNNLADITAEVVKIPKMSIESLRKIDGVKNIEGRISLDVPLNIKGSDEKVTVRIISVLDEIEINKLYLIDGNLEFHSDTDIFVIEQFIEGREIKLGDILTPQINGKTYNLNVVAEVGSPEFIYLMKDNQALMPDFKKFGVIYVSEKFAEDAFGTGNSYNEIIIDVKDGYNLKKVKNEVEKVLDKYGAKRVITKKDQLSYMIVSEEIKGGKKSSAVLPLVFLIVAGVILTIMINRLVKSDRMTIGVLKSMGYTNRQVLIHYSKFAIFIGLSGSITGVILGVLVSRAFTDMYLLYYKVHYVTVEYYIGYLIGAIILSLFFSVGAGILGAKDTLKIVPAEAMRKEAPKKGKRVIFENTKLWKKLNFTKKMVWRNLMRRKGRVMFIAMGVAITLLVVIVPLFLFAQMPKMFNEQFGKLQTMDYNIDFSRPTSMDEIDTIKNRIEYNLIEPKLEYPFEIESKWRSKIVSVVGMKKDTVMYHFENVNGEKIMPFKNFVFITDGLANLFEVEVGDKIQINNYIPGKDDITVEINGIIKQSLGSNIYMDIEFMQKNLVDKESINGVYINSKDNVKNKLENITNVSAINSLGDLSSSFEEFVKITSATISAMLFFGFILGFAIMYNTTIMTINSRTLEFSSLRILGMSRGEIIGIIIKENFIISILGVIIGIPISIYSSQLIVKAFSTDIYSFGGKVEISSLILGVIITFAFIIIAELAAYGKIRKMNFLEALKERAT
ncbi:MAG: FtsX-like permease family protein [Bacillota bacterium]|nr:FtsX-like permease family protein [Bacillota bacterium]